MKKSARAAAIKMLALCLLATGCSRPSPKSFDTSYRAPIYWKVVEEPLWGIRFNLPPFMRDKETTKTLWIHEGANLRVIVDFKDSIPSKSTKAKPNYSETKIQFNGLPALVCTYDNSAKAIPGSLNKVVALFYLGKREVLGGQEPSYRVEYASDDQRTTAFQILQTVRFYNS
ncbi:MAG TPA: hypothetical protein VGO56_21915 [Pyrinomonadaceae bacterium]|jgi:hypothetical protein|nr:hypothetical protein [Pyrinomonadaceae bacterium]